MITIIHLSAVELWCSGFWAKLYLLFKGNTQFEDTVDWPYM